MSEKFCLKWNDFHSNVSKSFGLFRNEEYLHDVTLVSDDHHQVSAHKLVLSACSEYFKNVFKNNNMPNTQTLLCLDGIAAEDLKNIMDYIYNGEVNIYQDSLDRFLGVAQRLKLEGLMGNEDSQYQQEDPADDNNVYAKARDVYEKSREETSHFVENTTKKQREVTKTDKVMVPISSEDIVGVTEARNTVQQYIETDADDNMKCTICGKETVGGKNNARNRWNLENHIETHLEGLSFPCQLCGKTFRSRNAFNIHKTRFHR